MMEIGALSKAILDLIRSSGQDFGGSTRAMAIALDAITRKQYKTSHQHYRPALISATAEIKTTVTKTDGAYYGIKHYSDGAYRLAYVGTDRLNCRYIN